MRDKKLEARLEVRLDPDQLDKLKKEAAEKNISVGSLVREAIDLRYTISREDKLRAVQQLADLDAPVTKWEVIKKEIAAEYKKEQ
jgi:uncharacterized protein (DUF1778 family)